MQTCNEEEGKYYPTSLNIPPEVQVETIEILNQTLADTIDLWMQVKCSHWNVKGMQFFALYQLFQEISEELSKLTDLIGERIVTLGGNAFGTVNVAARRSRIPQYPSDLCIGKEHVVAMSKRMAIYAENASNCIELAQGLGEADTAEIYTEISRAADRSLWLLEAHLQQHPE